MRWLPRKKQTLVGNVRKQGKDVITLGDITARSLGAVCLTDTLQDNRSSARNILIPVEFLTRTETHGDWTDA